MSELGIGEDHFIKFSPTGSRLSVVSSPPPWSRPPHTSSQACTCPRCPPRRPGPAYSLWNLKHQTLRLTPSQAGLYTGGAVLLRIRDELVLPRDVAALHLVQVGGAQSNEAGAGIRQWLTGFDAVVNLFGQRCARSLAGRDLARVVGAHLQVAAGLDIL